LPMVITPLTWFTPPGALGSDGWQPAQTCEYRAAASTATPAVVAVGLAVLVACAAVVGGARVVDGAAVVLVVSPHEAITSPPTNSRISAVATIQRRVIRMRYATRGGEIQSVEISVVKMTSKFLLIFLVTAVILELLDLVFRGYTALNSWQISKDALYVRDFRNIFVLQYGLGAFVPLVLLLIPRLTLRRTVVATLLILFGVLMMRYNVVIGGQSFSETFAGYMHYTLPIIPYDMERLKEGLVGALMVFAFPLILFYVYSKIFPVFVRESSDVE
jgi:hypothetical protein